MPKLSEYVEMAAVDYLQETGSVELDATWVAEFFQYSGIQDDYPQQDLIAFYSLVQKSLTLKAERAEKEARWQLEKVIDLTKNRRKP